MTAVTAGYSLRNRKYSLFEYNVKTTKHLKKVRAHNYVQFDIMQTRIKNHLIYKLNSCQQTIAGVYPGLSLGGRDYTTKEGVTDCKIVQLYQKAACHLRGGGGYNDNDNYPLHPPYIRPCVVYEYNMTIHIFANFY